MIDRLKHLVGKTETGVNVWDISVEIWNFEVHNENKHIIWIENMESEMNNLLHGLLSRGDTADFTFQIL